MRIRLKHSNQEIGGSYKHWRDKILSKHVEENYLILSQPDLVDVYEIDPKTGNKTYVETIDKYIAVTEYVAKSDSYFLNETQAKFDEFYRMTVMPPIEIPLSGATIKKNVNIQTKEMGKIQKVFVSHSSKDKVIVGEIIELLETIGVKGENIFCSSFEGYGISLGEDFLVRLKSELTNDVLVIFVLSQNFYESVICLCEMGATWIKTNEHIPILIPPFNYDNIKGVIQNIQGLKINEPHKLNMLKEKLELAFNLTPINNSRWESKRDKILERINKTLRIPNSNKKADSEILPKLENVDNAIKMIVVYAKRQKITIISFEKIEENISPKFNEEFVMDLVEKNPTLLSRCKLKGNRFGIKINDSILN